VDIVSQFILKSILLYIDTNCPVKPFLAKGKLKYYAWQHDAYAKGLEED
jgi:hypothetical protein